MDSDRKKFTPWLARIFSRRHHKTPAIQDAGDEIKFP